MTTYTLTVDQIEEIVKAEIARIDERKRRGIPDPRPRLVVSEDADNQWHLLHEDGAL